MSWAKALDAAERAWYEADGDHERMVRDVLAAYGVSPQPEPEDDQTSPADPQGASDA